MLEYQNIAILAISLGISYYMYQELQKQKTDIKLLMDKIPPPPPPPVTKEEEE